MKCDVETHEVVETTPQSPPLDVDDPGTPGCNQWEINLIASGNLSKEANTFELPLLDINYGIGDNLQLKYEVPNLTTQTTDSNASAVGNSKAGVKVQFFEDEESKSELALYPQYEFNTPSSGAVAKGVVTAGNAITLPLLFSKKIGEIKTGDVVLTSNLGYTINHFENENDYVSAALGIGAPISNRVSVMAEVSTLQAVSRNINDEREELVKVNLGAMVKILKSASVFGSFGKSLVSSDDVNHLYFVTGVRI